MTPWQDISPDDQLKLREDYARDTDTAPGTCSLDEKILRFSEWLALRGVAFSDKDVPRR